MNCRLCSSQVATSFAEAKLLGRQVQYFDCRICGYVQTEEPVWLEEAYASPIISSDTGIMARNLSNVGLVLGTLALIHERTGQVVDYAGGHGFLVRLLRDKGVDAYWADPYSENLVARGFEYSGDGKATLVAAFEAFEHFVRPVEEMEKLLDISSNILLTTSIIPRPAPQPCDWWYFGLDHGQHIGFYRVETLEYIANMLNLNLVSDGISTHLFTSKKYSGIKWRCLRQLAKHFPGLLASGLTSKTWSDHVAVSKL
ncbi:MAG: hypothetical protein ACI909_002849 [Planctomycetota bacterium]